MEQPKTKHFIIAVLLLGLTLSAYLVFFTPLAKRWRSESDTVLLPDYSTLYQKSQQDLVKTKKTIESLKDSLFGLKTERGYLEVELNKSKREVDEKSNNYDQAKKAKDTVKAIKICDSIVYNVIPVYWDRDADRSESQAKIERLTDSLVSVTDIASAKKDTVIAVANVEIKKLKRQKRNIFVAIGAAIAMVITTFIATH